MLEQNNPAETDRVTLYWIGSYNRNGIFFILPERPEFNENGLWQYKDAHFSLKMGGSDTNIEPID